MFCKLPPRKWKVLNTTPGVPDFGSWSIRLVLSGFSKRIYDLGDGVIVDRRKLPVRLSTRRVDHPPSIPRRSSTFRQLLRWCGKTVMVVEQGVESCRGFAGASARFFVSEVGSEGSVSISGSIHFLNNFFSLSISFSAFSFSFSALSFSFSALSFSALSRSFPTIAFSSSLKTACLTISP